MLWPFYCLLGQLVCSNYLHDVAGIPRRPYVWFCDEKDRPADAKCDPRKPGEHGRNAH